MTDTLSVREDKILEALPGVPQEIAAQLGVTLSHVYGAIGNLKQKGYDVRQDGDGRYFLPGDEPDGEPTDAQAVRLESDAKSTITRTAKETLAQMERELLDMLDETEPQIVEQEQTDSGTDLIIHRTDDHFGEVVTNQYGEEVFNSEIAEERVREVFDETMAKVEARRDAGEEFDNANLLLGGDIITGENIYDGQKDETDEKLEDQINRASRVYVEGIRRLSERFPTVKVVCQPGNHGNLGSGNATNADNIVYSIIDKVVRESDMDNVSLLRSDRSYYIDFDIRDWSVHLRHGHDASLEHIGTSAGKQRWLSWLVDHGFDVAFRGHYHVYKEEPINGRPVHMGGSILPQTGFEESHALSGRAVGAIHGATEVAPTEWTEKIYFG